MASDCNNTTEDPQYDWMEVLDNFLGSDEYERNDSSDSNDAGHQFHVQQQCYNNIETTTTTAAAAAIAPSSSPHQSLQEENLPLSNSKGYQEGVTLLISKRTEVQNDANNDDEHSVSVHTNHVDVTSIQTHSTNHVGNSQAYVAPSNIQLNSSTTSSQGITEGSSGDIINFHTTQVQVEASTTETTENNLVAPLNSLCTVNPDSIGDSTINYPGIRPNSDSVQISWEGTPSAFTPVVSTGISTNHGSTVIACPNTNIPENASPSADSSHPEGKTNNNLDFQILPCTNGADSSEQVVPPTEPQIPDVEKLPVVKTLDDAGTLKVDSCGASSNCTESNNTNQNIWFPTPMYYQPIFFAPFPFYGHWCGQQKDCGQGVAQSCYSTSATSDKKVDEGVKNLESENANGSIENSRSATGNHLETNYQSATNKLNSNEKTDGNNQLPSVADISSSFQVVIKNRTCSSTPSNNVSESLKPITDSNTNGAKILEQHKTLYDVTSSVPLLSKTSSSSKTLVERDPDKPFTCLSNTSVPCPILFSSTDDPENDKNGLEKNSTRADPRLDKTQCSKDRDESCPTDTSTMTSRDNDLHSTGLLPNENALDAIDNESKQQARSERKRNREKQRRTDVNAQFASLTSLLRRVEAEDLESDAETDDEDDDSAEGHKIKKRKKCSLSVLGALGQGSPSNRVDLIARTITVMDRLHELSAKRRTEVRKLKKMIKSSKSPEDVNDKNPSIPMQVPSAPNPQMMTMAQPNMMMSPAGKDGQQPFMMMVPMMMGQDGQPQGAIPNMPMSQMQFMGQGCYSMPGGQPGQHVKMPHQGMAMMPPGMYPGQPPHNTRNSPMPQMMPMYPGMNPQRMMPGAGPNNRSPHPLPNTNSPQPGSHQQVPQQPQVPQQTPPPTSRQQKNSNGGNLAHCA